jgi:hypothetical protein
MEQRYLLRCYAKPLSEGAKFCGASGDRTGRGSHPGSVPSGCWLHSFLPEGCPRREGGLHPPVRQVPPSPQSARARWPQSAGLGVSHLQPRGGSSPPVLCIGNTSCASPLGVLSRNGVTSLASTAFLFEMGSLSRVAVGNGLEDHQGGCIRFDVLSCPWLAGGSADQGEQWTQGDSSCVVLLSWHP